MINNSLIGFIAISMSCLSCTLFAQEESVRPGINDHYIGTTHDEWLPVFETESREVFANRYEILKALKIQPNMRIADIGAGTGFYSLLFAKQTGPSGKVYAVDITPDFIENIERRASRAGLLNLKGIINDARSAGLEKNSVDLVFICNTYHHFEYPSSMMASIHEALSESGEVVMIDYSKDPANSNAWIMGHVRANKQQVVDEMKRFGFVVSKELSLLEQNFYITFRKAHDRRRNN